MLDKLEKLSKILLSGVAATVIAYAGLEVEWKKLGLAEDTFCFDHADRAEAALANRTETIPDFLIDRYAQRCGVSFETAAVILNEDRILQELAEPHVLDAPSIELPPVYAQGGNSGDDDGRSEAGQGGDNRDEDPQAVEPSPGEGYVALGRADPQSYAQVNFDRAGGGPAIADRQPPAAGTLLMARWPVNLRGNTSNTTEGTNPILAVIGRDDCVRVERVPELLRGQYWAPVSRVPCGGG